MALSLVLTLPDCTNCFKFLHSLNGKRSPGRGTYLAYPCTTRITAGTNGSYRGNRSVVKFCRYAVGIVMRGRTDGISTNPSVSKIPREAGVGVPSDYGHNMRRGYFMYEGEKPNSKDRRFYKLLEYYNKPGWHGQKKHSALSIATRIMSVKFDYNVWQGAIDDVLK
ncbi:hypothetical protein CRG98_015057 [Punica granatum]|uniref:Uncharacterized protein n=1 Tax=Punica granatum TaxID=22663 RepID=A0A2I0K7U6_PUNGR|nr:hypothetical protein CRG98_015057 [Punica granatum]